MKKTKLIGIAALAAVCLTACGDDNGGNESGAITVDDKNSLSQTTYADQTSGTASLAFTTTGAWYSFISEEPSARSGGNPGWIAISPSEGDKAGNQKVAVVLDPNLTGADRKAVIKITCGDDYITATITQKSDKKEGGEVSFDDILSGCDVQYERAVDYYAAIDIQYSTLAAREKVTPATEALYSFWNAAYSAVNYCNVIIERADKESGMTEQKKNEVKATAYTYRGCMHAYLSALFGGVPLVLESSYSYRSIPRNPDNEVYMKVTEDLEKAMLFSGADHMLITMIGMQHMLAGEHSKAYAFLKEKIAAGNLWVDYNGDGVTNAEDYKVTVPIYLLAAEAALAAGSQGDAVQYVNVVYQTLGQATLPADVTAEQIRGRIKTIFAQYNTNMVFMNAARWGDTAEWGKYALMPIPQPVLDQNLNITQNSGW